MTSDAPQRRSTTSDFGVVAAIVSMLAVVVALVGVGFGMRAVDEAGDSSVAAAAGSAPTVELTEFKIDPASVTAPAGSVLTVVNKGATPHNLSVVDHDNVSDMLDGGEGGTLDLAGLEPGTYTLRCDVAGHADAGMTAELTVTEGTGETAAPASDDTGDHSAHGGTGGMSWQEMDKAMHDRTARFPEKTEGKGAQPLEPTVLADGTKQFDVTASVVDWEVEAGKVVEAWAYNGVVPGPTIKVGVGDKVRIVLKNELPESTAIHIHGLLLPNTMDGVPDITQPPVKPGETFAYEFTTREPAVGIYHSHHNAAKQVPNGLFAPIIVGDVPLPGGVKATQEIPMVLNDTGPIGFSLNGKSFPATEPIIAKLGDKVLIHYYNEGLTAHPMHLHGMPQTVVAKDGFPVEPYKADTINVAPGERYSVLVDVTEPGVWAFHCHILTHAEREDGMFGMVTAMIVE